ncbi:glycoside hydrolase family 95-like protein [Sphingobacterium sp. HMA12]|uniref:glycosyl hydrolase family 95 catalytic domain-containing protein n=1 Tax=Sphingobacterium sp. HMA12 TaxID=2050894 RepID=UPI000CEA6A31|nr:glycoside hydrolase N-terminal domain-containing protein [Sphingobacterium sp. HMA12]
MKYYYLILLFFMTGPVAGQPSTTYNLNFTNLATRWDEAIPLGNGQLGALIWKKDNTIRLSLDRADLWDERKAFELEKHDFKWVQQQLKNNSYQAAQQWGDSPYDRSPYPTKLPAAAMTFDASKFGNVISNVLDLKSAVHTLKFDDGKTLISFVHATRPMGYFEITGKNIADLSPQLVPHQYEKSTHADEQKSVVDGQSLARLGYKQGNIVKTENAQVLHQETYDHHFFEVILQYKKVSPTRLIGYWTIRNDQKAMAQPISIKQYEAAKGSHISWWANYWSKSTISIPEKDLERQYYLELYKLGATARQGAPAITLQAVWTADNGGLPPWKGDFHNDLNTQLSYWPAYTANRMDAAQSYTDWLWKIRPKNLAYTRQYFAVDGLNIPGVLTLNGYPMGGWIQYSLSPTVSAWTAQHFYWHWKYGMDRNFLKEQAYPYITEAATYLKNITYLKDGKRYLPLSSSPEYNDNSRAAWFEHWTNFDLSLAHYLFDIAAEVSNANGKTEAAKEWAKCSAELPNFATDETGLQVAVDLPMKHSHRHMSPYMAIYPLGILDINNARDKSLIEKSLSHLEQLGTRAWVGYSFSWMACLHARAKQSKQAVMNLQKFAHNFCSINSFHLNGDQNGGQYSDFTYRPFTLEGNFAFAQGIHELLIQSKNDYIEVFPATPEDWKNVSFKNLRTEGGFIVSAEKNGGKLTSLRVTANQNGVFRIFEKTDLQDLSSKKPLSKNNYIQYIKLKKGQTIQLGSI